MPEHVIGVQYAVDVRKAGQWVEIAALSHFKIATDLAAGILKDGRDGARVRDLVSGKVVYSVERGDAPRKGFDGYGR